MNVTKCNKKKTFKFMLSRSLFEIFKHHDGQLEMNINSGKLGD